MLSGRGWDPIFKFLRTKISSLLDICTSDWVFGFGFADAIFMTSVAGRPVSGLGIYSNCFEHS